MNDAETSMTPSLNSTTNNPDATAAIALTRRSRHDTIENVDQERFVNRRAEMFWEMREAMAPGSYFVISHGTWDHTPPDVAQQVEQLYAGSTNPVTSRSHAQIVRFFAGLDLVPPGVVFLPQWQPENADERFAEQPERAAIYAGVGRKTASAVVVTGDST